MKFGSIFSKLLLLFVTTLLYGCTLQEPDSDAALSNDDSIKLKSVSSLGITMFNIDYDNSGRITKMTLGGDEEAVEYEFQYTGTVTFPNIITCREYEGVWAGEKKVKELSEVDVWHDLEYVDGKITACTYSETQYFIDYVYDSIDELYIRNESSHTDAGKRSWEYDPNGYLISDTYSYDSDNGISIDKTEYTWKDGLLQSVYDTEESEPELTITYSEVNNIHRQWDFNNEIIGPIAITGFFGKAPAKYISEINRYSKGGHLDEKIYYSYVIARNGYIDMAKSGSDAEELSLTMKYHYIKK